MFLPFLLDAFGCGESSRHPSPPNAAGSGGSVSSNAGASGSTGGDHFAGAGGRAGSGYEGSGRAGSAGTSDVSGGMPNGGAGGLETAGRAGASAGGNAGQAGDDAGAGGMLETCDELALDATQAFARYVSAHQACASDDDCALLKPLGDCFIRCAAPVASAELERVRAAAPQFCVEFEARACPAGYLCPAPPPVICADGSCAFAD